MTKEQDAKRILLAYIRAFLASQPGLEPVADLLLETALLQQPTGAVTRDQLVRTPTHSLVKVLKEWREQHKNILGEHEWFAAESDEDSSSSASSESSSSSSDDSSSDESPSEESDDSGSSETVQGDAAQAVGGKSAPLSKEVSVSTSSASTSSNSSSSSESSSSSDSSSSDSSSDSSSSSSSSDDSSSSSDASSSSSSDSSSSDSSDADSDSESDSKPKAAASVSKKRTHDAANAADPIVAIQPVAATGASKKVKQEAGPGEVTVTKASGKKQNVPFSRINLEKIEYANDALRDNAYRGPDDEFGSRASADLLKTKGKHFTKEKNKKKRGAYKGGAIDQQARSFKFED